MANSQPARLREIASATLAGLGIVGVSDIHIAVVSSSASPYQYWEKWSRNGYWHTDVQVAHDACQGGRNEVVLISPESHPMSAALAWSKNMTHCVGMYGPARMNQRSRISHTATLANLVTVSGYGNTFGNLYFPYGIAATDIKLLDITGARNSFVGCHFLPMLATALDDASFALVRVANNEQFFKDCVFGGDTVAWTNGDMISFANSTSADPPRSVFENCLFLMKADNAQVNFITIPAGLGEGLALFRNCQFINIGTALTLGIDGTGLGNFKLAFDANCYFAGCTDVVTAGQEANVFLAPANTPINQVTGGASVALFNGLAAVPDVS